MDTTHDLGWGFSVDGYNTELDLGKDYELENCFSLNLMQQLVQDRFNYHLFCKEFNALHDRVCETAKLGRVGYDLKSKVPLSVLRYSLPRHLRAQAYRIVRPIYKDGSSETNFAPAMLLAGRVDVEVKTIFNVTYSMTMTETGPIMARGHYPETSLINDLIETIKEARSDGEVNDAFYEVMELREDYEATGKFYNISYQEHYSTGAFKVKASGIKLGADSFEFGRVNGQFYFNLIQNYKLTELEVSEQLLFEVLLLIRRESRYQEYMLNIHIPRWGNPMAIGA